MSNSYCSTPIVPVKGSIRELLLKNWQYELESAQAGLKKFAEEVQENPEHTMRWGDKVFMYAARVGVAKQMLELLVRFQDMDDIQNVLKENVLNGAEYIYNKSTSPSSNYMADCSLSVRAEALSKLRYVEDLDATKL